MTFMPVAAGDKIDIPALGSRPRQSHLFDAESIAAIDCALAAQRPLLIRGEPGIGKSQLALAAALALHRAYVQEVIDARTESRDLLWRYDAVARLAEAQLQGALREHDPQARGRSKVRRRLAVSRYLHPGPLWWGLDWGSAADQAARVGADPPPLPDAADAERRADPQRRCDPANGCVVLIDEIDKAESDVPNGLLEALGAGQFTPLGEHSPVVATGEVPLVVITTNEERALPDAFLRRCMVLHLGLPSVKHEPKAFKNLLLQRGAAHFPEAGAHLLEGAADLLIEDRLASEQAHRYPLPGQAEYLDLVRAVLHLAGADPEAQGAVLERIAGFALRKHPDSAAEARRRPTGNAPLPGKDEARLPESAS
jgi:MoxR-like ATPase